MSHGTEPATLDEHRLLVEHLRRLEHLAFAENIATPVSPSCTSRRLMTAIVDVREVVAGEVDHVDLDAIRAEPVEQGLEQRFRLVVQEARAVDEISPRQCRALPAGARSRHRACAHG
jgi:hypothetical protein